MKNFIQFLFLTLAMIYGSCATKVVFPISDMAPAAHGTAKVKTDKNNNYQIDLTIKHLADADRLNPPKSQYVVWILTEGGVTKNLGGIVSDRSNNAKLSATTSFKPIQIFVTAEEAGNVVQPGRQELFRSKILRLK
jgi:hypothetical protein